MLTCERLTNGNVQCIVANVKCEVCEELRKHIDKWHDLMTGTFRPSANTLQTRQLSKACFRARAMHSVVTEDRFPAMVLVSTGVVRRDSKGHGGRKGAGVSHRERGNEQKGHNTRPSRRLRKGCFAFLSLRTGNAERAYQSRRSSLASVDMSGATRNDRRCVDRLVSLSLFLLTVLLRASRR